MRDKNRIKPFLKKLEELWLQQPDLRFGQIICLLDNNIDGDIFYIEEDEWLQHINKLIK